MGGFLFGKQPKAQTITDPGVAASNQYFMNLAQQPSFVSPQSRQYRTALFGEAGRKAKEAATGSYADVFGGNTQNSGVLFGKLSDVGAQTENARMATEIEAEDRARGQVYAGMGRPQQQTVMNPGSKGLFAGLAETATAGLTKKYL